MHRHRSPSHDPPQACDPSRWARSGRSPTNCGGGSSRSSRSSGPGRPPDATSPTGGRCSTGSSSGCGAAASGTKMPERYGPKSTVHDWFQRWVEGGIFEKIWAVLVAECDELGGVQWQWQSADAMLGKARFGGEKDGQESHRSRQERDQEEPGDRGRRRPAGRGDRRGQRRGAEAAEGDDRGDRGRAARPG